MTLLNIETAVSIDYTNYRGERTVRPVIPLGFLYGSNQWHTNPQWLMRAFDIEKKEERAFAMKDIHSWNPLP